MLIRRITLALSFLAILRISAFAGGNLGNQGTFYKWHKVEVNLTGPSSSVTGTPNPFAILVNVTFSGPGGNFTVPAFYDADGAGGTSGSVWKVRFSANATGSWTFSSSSSDGTLNGYTGSFTIAEAPDSSYNLLKWGRLQYVGGHYFKFADGGYWIKGGIDDPENFLGTPFSTWAGKKSAIDTLSSHGGNSAYMIMNTLDPGDGDDVWPWYGSTSSEAKSNSSRFNPGKLLLWEDFFNYCESKGVVLYLIFDDDSAWHSYDHSLYYREMVARFGHHPAIIWNVGEEANENYSDSDQITYAGTIKSWDAYDHPVTVHRGSSSSSNWPFLGNANFDMTSMQVGSGGSEMSSTTLDNMNATCINNRNGSVSAGRPIPINFDEMPRVDAVNDSMRLKMRSQILYPIYLGGGYYEMHYKDTFTQGGSITLDVLAPMLDDMRYARQFTEALPFDQMTPNNSLLSSTSGNFCFAKPGLAYGIYMTSGATISLNLSSVKGAYQVTWYNVTTGASTNGSVIFGGGSRSLGSPAYSGDVACWVKRTSVVPGTSWGTATASDLGVDSAKLDSFASSVGGNVQIVKDGYVVKTSGTPSTSLNWASASKPTNGTAALIAINEGRTTMDTAIYPTYWSGATGKDRNITMRHMMNMLSGYMRPENPGAAFSYSDYNINLMTKTIYQKIFSSDPQTIMTNRLASLQFQDAPSWSTGTNYGRLTSCSVRDFTRIGLMWLYTGKWGSTTILPSTYFDNYCKVGIAPGIPQSSGSDTSDYLGVGTYGGGTNQSSGMDGFYGYLWWHNENFDYPDGTKDTFIASGHGGSEQMSMTPSLGLVAASDGDWNNGGGQNANFKLLKESVVPASYTDTEAPSVPTGVTVTTLTAPVNNSIQVKWTAAADNYAVKEYKVYRNGTQIGTSAWPSYTDTSASAGITYYYTVAACDYKDNVSAQSPSARRYATGGGDTTPPSVPTNVAATAQSSTSIQVTWTASTDNVGVSGYKVFRNGGQITSTASTSYTDTGLTPSTTYSYTVAAYDAANNTSAQSTPPATATTLTGDTQPPSVPTNVAATAQSASSIQVTWTASTDNIGVTGYKIYRNASQVGTSATTSYLDTGLTPSTTYSYTVSAYDAIGNNSAQSSPPATATTTADTQAPSVPTNVQATGQSSTSIRVTWTASTDNVAVTGYKVFRNGSQAGTSGTTNFTDTGLQQSTTYTYKVSAYDGSANESAQSSAVEGTTLGPWKQWLWEADNHGGSAGSYTSNWTDGVHNFTENRTSGGWYWSWDDPSAGYARLISPGGSTGRSLLKSASFGEEWSVDTGITIAAKVKAVTASGQGDIMLSVENSSTADINSPEDPGVQSTHVWVGWDASEQVVFVTRNGTVIKQFTSSVTFTNTWCIWTLGGKQIGNTMAWDLWINGTLQDPTAQASDATYHTLVWSKGTDEGTACLIGQRRPQAFAHDTIWDYVGVTNYGVVPGWDGISPVGDSQAPSVPTNVSATAQSSSSIQVNWTASTDNIGVTGYKIFRNTGQVGTSATTSYLDTGLSPSTTYSYTASAYDAAGNNSAQSSPPATATTQSGDTQAPSVPTGVTATAQSSTSIQVNWTASTDNIGVTGYKIFRNTSQVGTSATTSYTDTGLTPSTTYSYTVSAYDAASNNSAQSSPPATATTQAGDTQAPSVPTGVTATAQSSTSIQVNWTASTDNVGVTGYKIYRNTSQVGTSATTSYTDTGLTPSTTYSYTVSAYDAANNNSAQSSPPATATTFAGDSTPPSAPTNVIATAQSTSSIAVSWTASTDNVGVTGYKVFRNGSQIGTTASTSYTDTGLSANTTYSYNVSAYDAAGNNSSQSSPVAQAKTFGSEGSLTANDDTYTYSSSGDTNYDGQTVLVKNSPTRYGWFEFTLGGTSVNSAVIYVYNLWAATGTQNIEVRGAVYNLNETTLTWNNQPDASGWTYIGGFTATAGVRWYSVDMTSYYNSNLGQTVTLRYMAPTGSSDGVHFEDRENSGGTGNLPFIAYYNSDTQAPSVPTNVSATAQSSSSILVSWTASTDNVGVAGYRIYRNGTAVATSASTSYADTGLSPGVTYSYTVRAYDAVGNHSAASSPPATATTLDQTAPSVPTNVSAIGQTETTVQVTWTASTDNVGVTGYKIFRNAAQVGTSATTSYTDTGLTVNTTYSYTVSAYDAAGNNSAQSSPPATVTTTDSAQPSVPTDVAATTQTPTTIKITWTASTDNVGVMGYKIFRNGGQIGTSATTSYTNTGLTPDTAYTYRVSAYDAAGNNSAQSSSSEETTLADMSISDVKKLSDTSSVGLASVIVTAIFDDYFYVEEEERFSGVRVVPIEMPSGLAVGQTVDVGGIMDITSADERCISNATVQMH